MQRYKKTAPKGRGSYTFIKSIVYLYSNKAKNLNSEEAYLSYYDLLAIDDIYPGLR